MADHPKGCEEMYTEEKFQQKRRQYGYAGQFGKKQLPYQEIFEKYFPRQAESAVR